jgi:chloride channel protein, CIC family
MASDQFLRSRAIRWVQSRLTPDQFFFFSAVLVGLSAGLAAVALKLMVYWLHYAITYNYNLRGQYYIYLIFPMMGILISAWFIRRVFKGNFLRGIAPVIHSISRRSSILPGSQMYSQVVTAGFTVGLGGSAGLEAPIVATGAAIGSNFGRVYRLGYRERTLLLAAGAAGGIAGAFNAPIAGVLFATEVLLANISIAAFVPLLVSAASGVLVSKFILREDVLFSFGDIQAFNYLNVPFYAILGLFAGLVSVYYSRTFPRVLRFIGGLYVSNLARVIIGGILLAGLIWAFPPLFGEGYRSIVALDHQRPDLLMQNGLFAGYIDNPWMVFGFIVVVMMVKVFAAAITIGSGGNGGNFAPSLFVGAYLGFAFVLFWTLLGIRDLPFNNFTLVGMAGVLTGVFHAPLTGIFLIAEITGGYELMIPLMIVSAISYTVSKYFEPFSMDVRRLAERGDLITQDKDRSLLQRITTAGMVETDFQKISKEMTLGDLITVVSQSRRNIFPVVTASGQFEGVVLLDNIRDVMFKQELYDTLQVSHLMTVPPAAIAPGEDMAAVMKKFDETVAWNLPVLDRGKYIGFISKSRIFTEYRSKLQAEEE